MNSTPLDAGNVPGGQLELDEEESLVGLPELLTWIGEAKFFLAAVTLAAAVVALLVSLFVLQVMYTARSSLLAPNSQQQGGAAAALAALGSLGGLAGGLGSKTPDELYVALLRSDSVQRSLADRFDLQRRYEVQNHVALRQAMSGFIRVSSDKKSGLIAVEVDDRDPKFAADLANAHAEEVTKVLDRLAVSEAQTRRVFFEKQLNETKENLVKAELGLRKVQEKSGVIVLEKQAEALIGGAALLRAQIVEREVQMKVLRTAATEQNPEVQRLTSELRGLRTELARLESAQGGTAGSSIDIPVGKLPEAAIDYVRARREVKLQETLLEVMLRQYEAAKLDEAKEGPVLQQVDIALPPDYKSKPKRAIIVLVSAMLAMLAGIVFVVVRRYMRLVREIDPQSASAWQAASRAWSLRR